MKTSREQNESLINTDQRSSNKKRQRKGKSCKQSGRVLYAGHRRRSYIRKVDAVILPANDELKWP